MRCVLMPSNVLDPFNTGEGVGVRACLFRYLLIGDGVGGDVGDVWPCLALLMWIGAACGLAEVPT